MNVSDLTLEMVESYANACRDVHDYCETLRRSCHDLLVVPSRGAHPFIRGAQSFAHRVHSPEGSELPIPGFVRFQSLYLPFTADIDKDQAATSAEIRRYWARVLAAILKGDADNLALRFYQHLRSVAGRLAYGFNAIRSGTSDRFIFLDTVVSGRAIFEIMTAFEECGLVNCHYVLLLHQRGESLEPAYRRAINQMVAIDRATVIPVDSIFTEDEGPAMSGIWTVTMPELMEATKKLVRLSGVGCSGPHFLDHRHS